MCRPAIMPQAARTMIAPTTAPMMMVQMIDMAFPSERTVRCPNGFGNFPFRRGLGGEQLRRTPMSNRMPSPAAFLGLVAIDGYQNRGRIGDFTKTLQNPNAAGTGPGGPASTAGNCCAASPRPCRRRWTG